MENISGWAYAAINYPAMIPLHLLFVAFIVGYNFMEEKTEEYNS